MTFRSCPQCCTAALSFVVLMYSLGDKITYFFRNGCNFGRLFLRLGDNILKALWLRDGEREREGRREAAVTM